MKMWFPLPRLLAPVLPLFLATILSCTFPAFADTTQLSAPAPSIAKTALLRLALQTEPGIPFASARIEGMGKDAKGRWWVQGWTTTHPGFKGEPGEQWFIIWDGKTWVHHGHGTGMERTDIAAVRRWQDSPKTETRSETLITPGYIVLIEWHCPEGHVTCDDVSYFGTSRKSGKSLSLKGNSLHTSCRGDPGVPCRFVGYQFNSGGTHYIVGENGTLLVSHKGKTLFEEQGKWDWE